MRIGPGNVNVIGEFKLALRAPAEQPHPQRDRPRLAHQRERLDHLSGYEGPTIRFFSPDLGRFG